MAYVVGINRAVTVRHSVYNLAGTALVSGEASNITSALVDPDGASSAISVTVTEVGTTGYYSASFTPDALGVWLLTLTNPAGTDESSSTYAVQSMTAAAVGDVSGTWYTSLANLEERLGITGTNPSDSPDAYLNNLIARATARIESIVGRELYQDEWTEYLSGDGTGCLNLRRGPLSSVSSVSTVTYDSSRNESLSTVAAGNYLYRGNESNWRQPAHLISAWGHWTVGRLNYKVVYTAGYSTIPEDIEEACLFACVWMKNTRKDTATTSRDIGGGTMSFGSERDLDNELRQMLLPYLDYK